MFDHELIFDFYISLQSSLLKIISRFDKKEHLELNKPSRLKNVLKQLLLLSFHTQKKKKQNPGSLDAKDFRLISLLAGPIRSLVKS